MNMTVTERPRCRQCRRVLRAQASIDAGYGPRCLRKIWAAALTQALAGFTTTQAEKATDLIRDGGIVPTQQPGVWRSVASAGDVIYLTTPDVCSCPAGTHERACYHVAAARILTAARRAA